MTKITESKPVFSLSEQAQCLHREIQMRWAVYPGRVANKKMTQDQMDREIGLMDAAADTVEKMAKNGLFRETWNALAESRGLDNVQLTQALAATQIAANELTQNGELTQAYAEVVKLAGLTLRLAEVIAMHQQQPEAAPVTTNPTPGPLASQSSAGPAPSPTAAVSSHPAVSNPLTIEQKAEILRLANHIAIPRNRKTQVLLNINRLDTDKAAALLVELNELIEKEEGPIVYRKAS